MVFMPRGSVVIDVVPANNADKAPWVMFMGADYRPLHILPITLPQQKTVLMMHKVRRSKEWAMMTPYWRQRLLREGVCPEVSPGWWLGYWWRVRRQVCCDRMPGRHPVLILQYRALQAAR